MIKGKSTVKLSFSITNSEGKELAHDINGAWYNCDYEKVLFIQKHLGAALQAMNAEATQIVSEKPKKVVQR